MELRQGTISFLLFVTILAGLSFCFAAPIAAGELEPPGPPGPTMHTLDEIYDKLNELGSGAAPAPVEKTGCIVSHEFGDDGDLEKGVTWPNPRFTDNQDGTVTDNLTGLVWMRNAGRFVNMTLDQALEACNNLGDDGETITDGSTSGDWYLPNVKELQSLIHWGYYSPCLSNGAGTEKWQQGDIFDNVSTVGYWSSTPQAGNPNYFWTVSFHLGYVSDSSIERPYYLGWCVRKEL